MAEYTENYRLIKPGVDDSYNIADFNANADVIDEQLYLAELTGKTAGELAEELMEVSGRLAVAEELLQPKVQILAPAGTVITMSRGSGQTAVNLTATAGADHEAELVLPNIGEWQMSYSYSGNSYQRTVNIEHHGNTRIVAAPILMDAPWSYIDRISREGLADKAWDVGDEKNVSVNGAEYAAVILDFEHDRLATPSGGRTKAGITFQLKHCLPDACQWHSDENYVDGWAESELRSGTLPGILAAMAEDVRAVIKPVRKITASPKYSYIAEPQETVDEIFVPSEMEVWGKIYDSSPYVVPEEQYEYYRLNNTTRKKVDGELVSWWLRSPRWNYTEGAVCTVREHITETYTVKCIAECYVSFVFCV